MTGIGDWRNRIGSSDSIAAEAMQKADDASTVAGDARTSAAAAAKAASQSAVAWIEDIDITYNTVISLSLASRTKTFDVQGAQAGDRVYVHRRAAPTLSGVNVTAGIILEGTGFVSAPGKVEVYHVIPAVGLNQTLTIPLRLVGSRALNT